MLHIENATIHINQPSPMVRALLSAIFSGGSDDAPPATAESQHVEAPPAIGEVWPDKGGVYAGLARGEEGEPDGHLVLLDAIPDKDMNWHDAVKWADGLGDGARLPTRFESALLYANVRDKLDTNRWHWTGTQFSESSAWLQNFYGGTQINDDKSVEARCRAVRRFPV